jgi:hypothetical protein
MKPDTNLWYEVKLKKWYSRAAVKREDSRAFMDRQLATGWCVPGWIEASYKPAFGFWQAVGNHFGTNARTSNQGYIHQPVRNLNEFAPSSSNRRTQEHAYESKGRSSYNVEANFVRRPHRGPPAHGFNGRLAAMAGTAAGRHLVGNRIVEGLA